MDSSNNLGAGELLGSSIRRNQYKGGYTPEVLHEPFKSLHDVPDGSSHNSSNNGGPFGSPSLGSQLDDVPLTASPGRAGNNGHESASLSSSVRKHTTNRRSVGSMNQLGFLSGAGVAGEDSFTNSNNINHGASRPPSTSGSPRPAERNELGIGTAPGRGYFKHKVIPSLTSGVPPVLASGVRPKGWPNTSSASSNPLATGNSNNSTSTRPGWDSPQAWIVYYFIANLSLTLYNKLLMNRFPFAWSLTAIHALSGCIGAQLCLSRGLFVQQRLTTRENLVLVSFSCLYTINIAVSNLSLNLVTVPVSLSS
jgi:hypothetical protein